MEKADLLIDFWRLRRQQMGLKTIVRPFHRKKADVLVSLMLGQLKRPNLMILEPPRVGKTDLSQAFQELAFTHFPDSEFINTSYSDELAVEKNKGVRNTLSAQWYRTCCRSGWGATVKREGSSVAGRQDYFFTAEGGSSKGVGIGGQITGFGAGKLRSHFGGAIIIDDPLKVSDAESPTIRKKTITYITDTLSTRRNRKQEPMTPMILIMQRLHTQDPAGYFLSTERGRWTVVELPAYDEEKQESIWEARISQQELLYMKEYNPDLYYSQFQQNPQSSETDLLNPDWFLFYTDIKEIEKRVSLKFITIDSAFKEDDANDYSVLQCWGVLGLSGMALLDQVRGKWEFPDLVVEAKQFLDKHRRVAPLITPVTEAWVEDRASGTSLVQTLRRAGLPFKEWLPPTKLDPSKIIDKWRQLAGPDKVSRVKQASIPIKAGRILLPWPGMDGYRWVEPFVNECAAFTTDDSHLYDDQIDTMTCGVNIWMQRGGGVGMLPQVPGLLKWREWTEREI